MTRTIPGARTALDRLGALPMLPIVAGQTPIHEMPRLRTALGGGPTLLIKRDDAIPFGFGGNKVRKLAYVGADALASGADTLITTGGVQSNHARVTAAVAATLGMRCVLIANGTRPERPTANALLDALLGAEVRYVASREERNAALEAAADQARRDGRVPVTIPLGASTPLGAMGYVRAVGEMLAQVAPPDVIVHAGSSGGTQAGLVAGCAIHGIETRVIGVSPDDPATSIATRIRDIIVGMGPLLGVDGAVLAAARPIDVNDAFIGDGYGVPSDASREALQLAARHEAVFVDNTYTAKALAALMAAVRTGQIPAAATVLFWHTGGQVGIFA
ncbi:MAG TPA: pyridoxal-phosphate dependent enzyme [Gemmatimonadaceae bacterium]|jgi:1-aminocyclopropane-1-carboxylate deaminase/D-cysteine desulfhydrase-like pyridoxal-dependent ACC family enzyme